MISEVESVSQEPHFAAFVGIDWADQKHVWCLQSRDSTKREIGELKHTPEAVEAWVAQLCQRFGNRPIAVALEQSRGSLVFMLAKYEPLHLFPVPSTMSASMRVQTLIFRVDKNSIGSTTGLILVESRGTTINAIRVINLLTSIRDTVAANLKPGQEGKTHLKDELKTRTALNSVFYTCMRE